MGSIQGSKEIFVNFSCKSVHILHKNFTFPDIIILQKFRRKPNINCNFLVKLYTVVKNTAGFVRFYKWTLVLSNWDYKRYIIKIINGVSGENLRKFWKLLLKMQVFLQILSFIFEFAFFPRFGGGTLTFCFATLCIKCYINKNFVITL